MEKSLALEGPLGYLPLSPTPHIQPHPNIHLLLIKACESAGGRGGEGHF